MLKKAAAFDLLGVTNATEAAALLGITPTAVRAWPQTLTRSMADRVMGVVQRREWRAHLARYGEDRVHVPPHIRALLDDSPARPPKPQPEPPTAPMLLDEAG